MKVTAVSLSEESLLGIGHVLTPRGVPSAKKGEDFAYSDTNLDIGLEAPLSSGALLCLPRPAVLSRMERHMHSREMLVALEGDSVVFVAPPQESRDGTLRGVRALKMKSGQAFIMEKGAWHWIPFPEGKRPARCLVVFRSKTGTNDIQFQDLSEPCTVGR